MKKKSEKKLKDMSVLELRRQLTERRKSIEESKGPVNLYILIARRDKLRLIDDVLKLATYNQNLGKHEAAWELLYNTLKFFKQEDKAIKAKSDLKEQFEIATNNISGSIDSKENNDALKMPKSIKDICEEFEKSLEASRKLAKAEAEKRTEKVIKGMKLDSYRDKEKAVEAAIDRLVADKPAQSEEKTEAVLKKPVAKRAAVKKPAVKKEKDIVGNAEVEYASDVKFDAVEDGIDIKKHEEDKREMAKKLIIPNKCELYIGLTTDNSVILQSGSKFTRNFKDAKKVLTNNQYSYWLRYKRGKTDELGMSEVLQDIKFDCMDDLLLFTINRKPDFEKGEVILTYYK